MQDTLARQMAAEDRRVGIAVGVIGVFIALFIALSIAGLSLYWSVAYSGLG